MQRKTLTIEALPGFDEPEIGRWIWGLEDVRRTILKRLAGIRYEHLNHKAADRQSIGSLLYHIAFIEADWLYAEVLESDWDPKIKACFPGITVRRITVFPKCRISRSLSISTVCTWFVRNWLPISGAWTFRTGEDPDNWSRTM